jgi:phosphocarrier protein
MKHRASALSRAGRFAERSLGVMMDEPVLARRRVQIVNAYGLHVRPATKFVKLAQSFRSEVQVEYEGRIVNGKSLLDMTGLAAECGTALDLEAEGPDAEAALAALADLVAAGFHMTDEDYLPQNGPRPVSEAGDPGGGIPQGPDPLPPRRPDEGRCRRGVTHGP